MIRLIAAIDQHRGIATENGIPWQGKIPTDTRYFREQTSEGTLVMGYRTYLEMDHPLHEGPNFVVSRPDTPALRPGFVAIPDLAAFLHHHTRDLVWVLGGAAVFAHAIPMADELYITQLDADFRCTLFFPAFRHDFLLAAAHEPVREADISFRFEIWQRTPRAETH